MYAFRKSDAKVIGEAQSPTVVKATCHIQTAGDDSTDCRHSQASDIIVTEVHCRGMKVPVHADM